jgi:polar amino acid transport system substrate-binding protein
MKQLRRLGLALGLLLAAAPAAQSEVRFGISGEKYSPFYSKNADGQWVGWEIDMMNAVCRAMNENCSIIESSWDSIIPALNAGDFDVIWASMTITEERLKVIDFTNPYYKSRTIIVGQRNGDPDSSPSHLAGKTIGFMDPTVNTGIAEHGYPTAVLKYYNSEDELLHDLSSGQIDYILTDLIWIQSFLASPAGACCELKNPLLEKYSGGVGGGVRKNDGALKSKLNAAIKAILDSGEYDTISKKYFAVDISPR